MRASISKLGYVLTRKLCRQYARITKDINNQGQIGSRRPKVYTTTFTQHAKPGPRRTITCSL